MEKLTLGEATALDFSDALDDGGAPHPGMRRKLFSRYARMIAGGPSVCLRDGGALVLIAGLYRDVHHLEAWFAPGPALRRNLPRALIISRRLLRMAMRHEAQTDARAYISPKSVAGSRLAAWFGFVSRGMEDTPLGRLEVWTWTRSFPCNR